MSRGALAVAAVPRPDDAASRDPVADGAAQAAVAPNFLLLGTGAGVLVGALELTYAAHGSAGHGLAAQLQTLAVTASLLGIVGFLYGGMVQLLEAATRSSRTLHLKLLVVAGAGMAAATRYKSFDAAVVGAALCVGIAWAWWRASARGAAVVLVWAGLLYVLSPLFSGRAMDRVFTDLEATVLFIVVVSVLPLLAVVFMSAPVVARHASRMFAVVAAVGGVGLATVLTVCSSVFLIRLWGFNTMAYLEVTLLVLKIACLTVALAVIVAHVPVTGWTRPRRETNLLMLLALLALLVLSAYGGMRNNGEARLLLAQLPDTSFIANRVADLLDADHDGYSAAFGFGDCDDTNPDIFPGAIDWPGDGIDENCFGGDLKSIEHGYFNRAIDVQPPVGDTTPARRKVVVFVLIDTLRADAVDYSVQANSVTPEIARIARHGLRLDHAYAQSNNTLESMPFLMHLGFRDLPRYDERWTLPTLFKAGGVDSVGVFQAPPRFWFSDLDDVFMGFDRKLFPDEQTRYHTPAATTALALEQLQAHTSTAPLFLYVHFESLHDSFTQMMEGDRLRTQGANLSEAVRLWDVQGMVALMKQRYLAALTSVDQAVGTLFDGVRKVEDTTDVLFILTADHGEEFYDHGGLFHMGTLHEELVRVPLMFYETGGAARTESSPVGLYRVPATLLRWLGYRGEFLDDLNLLRTPILPLEIFGYFSFAEEWQRRSFMIVEDGYKLIYDASRGRLEMFDLGTDPQEMHNLVGDPQSRAVQERLVAKMDTTMFFMNYGDVEYARHMQASAASFP